MTETVDDQNKEETLDFGALLAEYEDSAGVVEENGLIDGTVLSVTKDHVLVDIGYKSEGLIPLNEFLDEEGKPTVKVGDKIQVLVESRENDDGLCVLSKDKADRLRIWELIAEAAERDELVEGTITNRVKGGLSVDIGVKAFLPGSQVELRPTRNLDKYLGQTFKFKVIKFNKRRGNIVLSRRALLEKERESLRKDTLERLKPGMVVEGIVKNITDYGAFIDLGGIDGLLHVTDMSWGRVNHPEEIVKIGESLRVMVMKFDLKRERVSLGLKQLQPDPWSNVRRRYPPGTRQLGRVVSLIDYGAFVELEDGIEGLIHISEMSWTRRIKHPSKVVGRGDVVEVVVLSVDPDEKKISLGMKQMAPNPWTLLEEKYPAGTRIVGTVRNITDFGVFIGIEEGIDGLVHISDISWTQKIKHPAEVFKKGDEVEAVVLNIDVENERFSLGIKQLTPDPWEIIPEEFPPGRICDATVTKITDFGAFAEIGHGVEGLIHISQLSTDRVENPADVVKVGDTYKVEVISVDARERKIALSIKSFIHRMEHGRLREYRDEAGATASLGDVLSGRLEKGAESNPAEAKKKTKPKSQPADEPVESQPADEPVESQPADEPEAQLADEPVESQPANEPVESQPADEPVESQPADEPVDSQPADEPEPQPAEQEGDDPSLVKGE
ncbi:MAG: 30S ribosomal protein S1 [Bradymonadales bacterium]|nr:30S ribosomal protein S1 [Bradymonadales bacterium]